MGTPSSTHQLTYSGQTVTKTYRSWSSGEHRREWSLLGLLHRHAPGLAATPLEADLDGEPPWITMTRLPGIPLGASRLSTTEVAGLATALRALHDAVPPDELGSLEHRRLSAPDFTTVVGTLLSAADCSDTAPDVILALTMARTWFDTHPVDTAISERDRVLGIADGNLANYLWDGSQVRFVDFEDAGVSDRCFELADTIEHPSAFVSDTLDPVALLAALDLDDDQHSRVLGYRKLFACFWLIRLLPGGPAHHRNPPGTLEKYADRAAVLLSAD